MKNKLILIFFFLFLINTNLFSEENFYEIKADKIEYQNANKIIIAEGNALIYDQTGLKIFSDKIVYNRNKGTVSSYLNTKFIDEQGNSILTNSLNLNTKTNEIFTQSNTKIIDKNKNLYNFKKIFYNTKNKVGSGIKFNGSFNDESSIQSENIKFNLITGKTILLKSNYTTCKNISKLKKENCPWWTLQTSKTTHDQNTKTVTHKNALLKIKNIPVLYVPYLKHPDPSVKRRSGFLAPGFKSVSSIGKALSLPYFFNINESEDITITPVLYIDKKPLMLAEYRKKFKKSQLIIDTSFFKGFNDFERKNSKGSSNHLYVNYDSNFKSKYFFNNQFIFQLQKISRENYLKNHQINTLLTKEDDQRLENKIQLLSFNNSSSLDLNAKIFEDVNKKNNIKYEYVFPSGSYSYNLNKFSQNINFKSDFINRKFDEDESGYTRNSEIINQINTFSNPNIFKKIGTSHTFKTKVTNINSYSKDNNLETDSINNYITVALDNSLPFYKKKNNSEEIINPKIFIKYTTGSMKNANSNNKILRYSDIYSMDRSDNISNPETGLSFGTGFDYEIRKKNQLNNVYFKNLVGFGQVFRTSKLDQMPRTSSLDNKQSSFAGFYNISFLGKEKINSLNNKIKFLDSFNQNKIDLKYDFNLNKNLSSLDQNTINLSATIFNRINSNINFDEKNKYAGNERKINYELNVLLNNNFYLSSNVINNLKDNLKESEKFGLSYENDCIKIGFFMKKDFYSNQSSNRSALLNILIKPFANDLSPDLSSFVK